MSNKLTIKETLERGEPYYGLDESIPKNMLDSYVKGAQEACLAAHEALYTDKVRTIIFDDEHSGEVSKFISFVNKYREPCYNRWDKNYPATDVGIRGVNLDFDGTANPTTIVHGDNLAPQDFQDQGAPEILVEALDSVALLNKFVLIHVVHPMLTRIAKSYGENPQDYIEQFIPTDRRIRTLTRVIMYHLDVPETLRPVGGDGAALLIKEHYDQSSFTIDSSQSSSGLQYHVNDQWLPAETSVACMRGTADDLMHETMLPTLHRAVFNSDSLINAPSYMKQVGIGRIATPTFVSPSGDSVRVVRPSSPDTHPTAINLSTSHKIMLDK